MLSPRVHASKNLRECTLSVCQAPPRRIAITSRPREAARYCVMPHVSGRALPHPLYDRCRLALRLIIMRVAAALQFMRHDVVLTLHCSHNFRVAAECGCTCTANLLSREAGSSLAGHDSREIILASTRKGGLGVIMRLLLLTTVVQSLSRVQ